MKLNALALRGLLGAALVLAGCGVSAAERIAVRIAPQMALEPKWIAGHGPLAGICPDILAAIERVEPRVCFTGLDASRSLPGIEAGLAAGSLDAACALIPSPRRSGSARTVGKPVYTVRHRLAARADDPVEVASVADLVRLKALVTSQRGSAFTDRLKAAGVRVDDATDDNGLNLRKMLAGHGRFAYMNELTLRRYLRTESLQARVRVLPEVLAEAPAYFWVSNKADPALAPLLGDAIDQLKASGELDRIYTRWAATP
jgi:polar amino acid transport system substrate-binding protein